MSAPERVWIRLGTDVFNTPVPNADMYVLADRIFECVHPGFPIETRAEMQAVIAGVRAVMGRKLVPPREGSADIIPPAPEPEGAPRTVGPCPFLLPVSARYDKDHEEWDLVDADNDRLFSIKSWDGGAAIVQYIAAALNSYGRTVEDE